MPFSLIFHPDAGAESDKGYRPCPSHWRALTALPDWDMSDAELAGQSRSPVTGFRRNLRPLFQPPVRLLLRRHVAVRPRIRSRLRSQTPSAPPPRLSSLRDLGKLRPGYAITRNGALRRIPGAPARTGVRRASETASGDQARARRTGCRYGVGGADRARPRQGCPTVTASSRPRLPARRTGQGRDHELSRQRATTHVDAAAPGRSETLSRRCAGCQHARSAGCAALRISERTGTAVHSSSANECPVIESLPSARMTDAG